MRIEHLVESKRSTVELTEAEALALSKAGRRLASSKSWWGDDSAVTPERSVIRCRPASNGKWSVTVQDAVGIVSIGHLQIIVEPKIPQSHLLYLLAAGEHIPRLDDERGGAQEGASLWRLVATWYVQAAEKVLRRDLLKDYAEQHDFLPSKRGRIIALPTARAFYGGRMGFECQFEEFTVDTPLNRVIKAAAIAVLGSKDLPRSLRRRAQAIRARMFDVGELKLADVQASIDRRASYYSDAIQLARHILRSQGRILASGHLSAWTFLIRTPEMVEDGLRRILHDELGPDWSVEKRGRSVGSGITFTPDIVFRHGNVVADVKYKLMRSDWNRADLYQAVAFGTAFGATHSAVLGFRENKNSELPRNLTVGSLKVSCLGWIADPATEPNLAASRFVNGVRRWLLSTQAGVGEGLSVARQIAGH